ncbi:MAG: Ser-Thr-rich GPI-anchored membrane family protein [Thermoplasmata archaeon]
MKRKRIPSVLAILVAFFLIVSGLSIAIFNYGGEADNVDEQNIENDVSKTETNYRYATKNDIEQLKSIFGVREPGKNYNQVIDGRGTGMAPPTEQQYNEMIGTLEIRVDDSDDDVRAEEPSTRASTDYTTSPYMPPMGDQGQQGSCCAWSATYYALTFQQAQAYNQDVSGGEWNNLDNPDYVMSPAWSYNMINNGEDEGTNWAGLWDLSTSVGNSNYAEMPYTDSDYSSWGSESAWRSAAQFKSIGHYMTANNDDDTAINAIKTRIDEGRLVGFGIDASAYPTNMWGDWQDDEVISTDDWGTEEELNHANTIVGYDDQMTDPDGSPEEGAFLVANSWGTGWGPYDSTHQYAGMYWMTYDCYKTLFLNWTYELKGGAGTGAVYDDTDAKSPELLSTWTFSDEGDRDPGITMGIALEDGGDNPYPEDTLKPLWDGASKTRHPYPSFMAIDVTDFSDEWNQGNGANYFYLQMAESSGSASTMDSFYVEYYDNSDNDPYDYNTVNYDDITINSPDAPASNPCVMWTTFTYPDGSVSFDQTKYAVEDTIGIQVVDSDLSGAGGVAVDVTSPDETETLSLSVDAKYDHIWVGTIPCSATDDAGTLLVSGGDTITVTYADASHGDKTDTAEIDATPPVVTSGPTETNKIATLIEFTVDEPSTVVVNYGLSDPPVDHSASETRFKTTHAIAVDQLDDDLSYNYELVITNEAELTTTTSVNSFTAGSTDDVEAGWVNWTEIPCPSPSKSAERWQIWSDEVYSGSYAFNIGNGGYGNSWCDNLTTPWIDISAANSAEMLFWHEYDTEPPDGNDYWDGGVVDVRTDNTDWERGTTDGGYDGTVYADYGDTPLAGQEVWGGDSGGWRQERLDLSPWIDGVATRVQCKFFFASDAAVEGVGWNIDDITMSVSSSEPPQIEITSPNGGENWAFGEDREITWTTTEMTNPISHVNLHYSVDNGNAWTEIAAGEPDDGTYTWSVPNEDSDQCLVRGTVVDDQGLSGRDSSDATFTITSSEPPSARVLSPNGGEQWKAGEYHDITWSYTAGDGTVTTADLHYSSDGGGNWEEITTGLSASNESYNWRVPRDPSTTCLVRVTIHDDLGMSGQDESDDYFEILGLDTPSITILTPNGGESWEAGTNHDITWDADPGDYQQGYSIDLEYSTDNGATYTDIVENIEDTGSYTWTVPDDTSDQCLVRGTASGTNNTFNDYAQTTDTSDDVFEIYNFPDAPSGLTVEHYGVSSTEDTSDSSTVNTGEGETNDHTFTHTQDNSYHQVTETRTGGPPSNPAYEVDVVYSISISGANTPFVLYLDAYREDDEAYDVNYQVNGGGYTNLGEITAGSDTDTYLSWELTGVANGDAVDVQITDTTAANGETQGTLYVDHLYIESSGSGGSTDDNAVNWTASADDGGGDNDVDHYEIYRADTQAGLDTASVYTNVTADESASYSYVDSGAGTADSTIWWYRVCAIDADGRESGFTSDQEEPSPTQPFHDLGTLDAGGSHNGWHFLSYNLTRTDTSLTSILDDATNGIAGNYDKVMCYDASIGEWKTYVPGRSDTYNDLSTWTSGMGIWVHMTGTDDLVVMGDSKPDTTSITLYPGWNMVSYPSSTSGTDAPADVSVIGYYDASATYNIAYDHTPGDHTLNPGEAYWLYLDLDTTYTWDVTY